MVLELVDEKGLRRARPVQRQRVDRAHRPGAPGSKQQGAAVRRDVTAHWSSGATSSDSAGPVPSAGIQYRSPWLNWPREYTTRLPSGVQMGRWPDWSKVRRVRVCCAMSYSHTSEFTKSGSSTSTAIRRPSGDSRGAM